MSAINHDPSSSLIKRFPGWTAVLLTVVGYALVIGTLYSDLFTWLYPQIGLSTVNALSHCIATVNIVTIFCLSLGWYWIRQGDTEKHPKAMSIAFGLILIFLVLYLIKTGGGGRKEFVGPSWAWWSYILMLGTHIILSIFSVPLVVYALLLGSTRRISEVSETSHKLIGRYAAGSWIVSLILGVLAYVLLNHIFAFEFVPA